MSGIDNVSSEKFGQVKTIKSTTTIATITTQCKQTISYKVKI